MKTLYKILFPKRAAFKERVKGIFDDWEAISKSSISKNINKQGSYYQVSVHSGGLIDVMGAVRFLSDFCNWEKRILKQEFKKSCKRRKIKNKEQLLKSLGR